MPSEAPSDEQQDAAASADSQPIDSAPVESAPVDSAQIEAEPAEAEQPTPDEPAADEPAPTTQAVTVPAALQFRAPLVGGGEMDAATLADKPTVFWFWAPT